MKKILLSILLLSILLMMFGCSSEPAAVESETNSEQTTEVETVTTEPTEYANYDSLELLVDWLQRDTVSFCATMSGFTSDMMIYEDVERLAEQLREEVIIPGSDDLKKGLIDGISEQEAQELLDTLQLVDEKVTESLEFCENFGTYEGYEFEPTQTLQDELYLLVGLDIQ